METRILPVEKPKNLLMRLAYHVSRAKMGKVLTTLKVIYARLPFGFTLFYNKIPALVNKVDLPDDLKMMIKLYVAQINICEFCIDITIAQALEKKYQEDKFYALMDFELSDHFTEAEKAALRFAGELTRNKKIEDATFNIASKYFADHQLVGIVWLVAIEHYYNCLNLAFDITSDNFCDLRLKRG